VTGAFPNNVRLRRDFDCVGLDYNAFYPGEVRLEALENLLNAPEQPAEYQVFFYHSDHLGSSSFITDINGDATQHLQYLLFGEDFVHQQNTAACYAPYTFSGKERDVETNLSYFGARYYEAGLSVWLSVDPKAHSFPTVSPFTFNMNNPVMFIDPGGDSTFVINLGNSRYQVVGAEVKSGNRGIYEVCLNGDGNRELTGNVIGISFTTHSFVDESDEAVVGAVIDLKSTEASRIVKSIHSNTPSTANYVANWKDYNYKGNNNLIEERYRGSRMPNGEIASMRDVGNYVAGYTFGYNGWPLSFARVGFERLQATGNLNNLSNFFGNGTESRNSVLAQNRGWLAGYKAQLSRRTGRNYD